MRMGGWKYLGVTESLCCEATTLSMSFNRILIMTAHCWCDRIPVGAMAPWTSGSFMNTPAGGGTGKIMAGIIAWDAEDVDGCGCISGDVTDFEGGVNISFGCGTLEKGI